MNKNNISSFYKTNKQLLLYLFFGGLTTLISIFVFTILHISFGINEHISNLFSWVFAVLFAFITNKGLVFNSKTTTFLDFILQMLKFYFGRLVTLGIEEIIIFIFITKLGFNSFAVKTTAQIVVIILNYIISKYFIFKNKKES